MEEVLRVKQMILADKNQSKKEIQFMKDVIFSDEIVELPSLADSALSKYVLEKYMTTPTASTLKSLQNGIRVILIDLAVPSVVESPSLYPKLSKIYSGWRVRNKENPVEVKSAAAIDVASQMAMKSYIPVNDYESMLKFYFVVTTGTGCRGGQAMHDLKTTDVRFVEFAVNRGK